MTQNLPAHWKAVQLGNVAKVVSGGTPSRTESEYWNGDIPWVKTGEINYNIITETDERITQAGLRHSSARMIPSGTLLMAMYGQGVTRGRVAILGIDAAINQACAAILTDEAVATEFLFFSLTYSYEKIRNLGHGANQKNLNAAFVKSIKVPLPPLPEQQQIAHTLQTVQQAKETRQRELEVEQERKAALMQHLFTYGTRGEARKQTEIGEIPESWEVVKLGNWCEFLQYGTSTRCDASTTETPVLRVPNVIRGCVDISDLKFIERTNREVPKLKLKIGDLLFVRTNGNREYTGRCAVFQGELEDVIFASYLIRARVKTNAFLPEFVQFYATIPQGKRYLSGCSSNAADGKYNINTQTIKGVLLPKPELKEQQEVVTTLQACDTKISTLQQEINLLDELFRAMLEALMTGQLSVLPLVKQK